MADKRIFDPSVELIDREAVESIQLTKLLEMLRHIWSTNDFYRSKWQEAGVKLDAIKSFADFAAAIPLVEKGDFVADQKAYPPFGSRLAHPLSLKQRLDLYTTSGTSGQGVEIHAQTERELRVMEHIYGFYFHWAGMTPGDRTFLTLPITMLGGGRIEYQGAIAHGLTVMPAGNYDARQKLDLIERFRPRALYGSTSYFGHLAALSANPKDAGIEVLLTGLEGVGFSFLKRLEEQWGARAADRFGCTQMRGDFMFTAEEGVGEDRAGVLLNLDPFVYLEMLDTTTGLPVQDGEFGELVVTSLYHFDNPVVRNRLRDGAIFRRPRKGSSFRAFSGIEVASVARTDDVKKVKGINLYPQAVDDLMFTIPEVDEYQVVLRSAADMSDIARIDIMPKSSVSLEGRDDFVKRIGVLLREKMGISFAVEIVSEVQRSEYKARRWRDERIR